MIARLAAAAALGAALAAAALWPADDPAPVTVPAGVPFDYATYVDGVTGTGHPAPPVTSWQDLVWPVR